MFGWEEKTKTHLARSRDAELSWLKFQYYLQLVNNLATYDVLSLPPLSYELLLIS